MLQILGITFPIFALIALGYAVTLKGVFKSSDMQMFGNFVMNIALPALIFKSVATRSISEVLQPAYALTYIVGTLATLGVSFVWFRLSGAGPNRCAVGAMGACCPNSAFVGYPILLLALPAVAEPVLALNFLVETFVVIPVALFAIEMAKEGTDQGRVWERILRVLLAILKRPLMIGLMLGLVVSASGISLPAPVLRLAGILANSAAGLALFVIGGALVGLELRGNRLLAAQIVAGKLVLHPLLMAASVVVLGSLGFGLSDEMRAAVILSASMPMFTIFTLFAQESGHEGLAATAQVGATIVAFVTVSVALALLI